MKGLAPLFIGIFGTFAFSWVGLTVIPNWQIGSLNPQSDEEGTDIYPRPQSGMFQRGAHVYAANGCVYCHSQQVRADYIADDIERKWGDRRSAPRDYIFQRPVFLGKMRMGQDLANIGARAPAPEESPSPAGGASPSGAPATQKAGASPAVATAASPSSGSSPATAPAVSPASAALPAQLRQMHRHRQVSGPALLLHHPDKWRTLLPAVAVLPHQAPRLPARYTRFRQQVCRRCIPPRGIMCICLRRAASILIQTCRRTVSSIESDA